MGADGGSIPQRVDLVKMKNKKLLENTGSLGYNKNTLVTIIDNNYDKKRLKEYYFNHCAISQENLKEPIMCCRNGYLYNKESILNLILLKKKKDKKEIKNIYKKFNHIKSLKDVVLCKNKLNEENKLICLISKEIINLNNGGICFFSCGCVFSKKVIKHIDLKQINMCLNCNQTITSNNIIEIGKCKKELKEKKEKKTIIKKRKLDSEEKKEKKKKITDVK